MKVIGEWAVVGWEGEGVTNKPYVAVDSGGDVYATAPDYHWVIKFDGSGKVEAVWGQYGSDISSLNMPSGIAVDGADNIYVLDSANHRVLKFAPLR
jgi:DNA-binding beta-propeller fold protein YncE